MRKRFATQTNRCEFGKLLGKKNQKYKKNSEQHDRKKKMTFGGSRAAPPGRSRSLGQRRVLDSPAVKGGEQPHLKPEPYPPPQFKLTRISITVPNRSPGHVKSNAFDYHSYLVSNEPKLLGLQTDAGGTQRTEEVVLCSAKGRKAFSSTGAGP